MDFKDDCIYLIIPLIISMNILFIENLYKSDFIKQCSTKNYYKVTTLNVIRCEVFIIKE